jgi:two-component system chemotaxis response regulator CheB
MPIRILVVDDSVVVRKLLTGTLNEVPDMEVVATAALGKIALAKIEQYNPDVVILDVEMPEMDGIETLKRIRKLAPRLPVIMFSTKTERGATATIEALTCGASDYVTKPSHVGNVLVAMARVREDMVPKIKALTAGMRTQPGRPQTSPLATPRSGLHTTSSAITTVVPIAIPPSRGSKTIPLQKVTSDAIARPKSVSVSPVAVLDGPIKLYRSIGPRPPIEIVAIGASTGGPNALATVLGELPADFPVPIVIVQHMLASFTRHFAGRLASQCQLKIVEATAGEPMVPGYAYIARGDHHLLVERRGTRWHLAMNQEKVENFCRPAVDVLFRSVAHGFGAGALAVVLTGMGHDGLLGSTAIREAGGDVIVQDLQSSVVWGMPGFVARAGIASSVLAIEHVGGELRRRAALGPPRLVGASP